MSELKSAVPLFEMYLDERSGISVIFRPLKLGAPLLPFGPAKTELAVVVPVPVPPLATAMVVPLQVPLVIVPTFVKLVKEVNVLLLVAVIFPAVIAFVASVAVAALPVIFPITFDPLTVLIFASDTAPSASLIVVIPPSATPPPELFAVT